MSLSQTAPSAGLEQGYRTALLDWLACALGGHDQRAARAARALGDGLGDRIAAAASRLLDLDADRTAHAVRLALLQAGGLRAAFGSDGKALQVGRAAAAGATGARLAAAGAVASADIERGEGGFEQAYAARWLDLASSSSPERAAVRDNWIKAYPCCLQTHGAIEAAVQARSAGAGTPSDIVVTVHPVCLHAASLGPDVRDGLQAKFSIPYLTAYSLLHGPPRLAAFEGVDDAARALAHRIELRTDDTLLESEAVLEAGGERAGHVEAALGSPARPMDEAALRAKLRELAGSRLDGALDDLRVPAAALAGAAGLS
jgi:2-methylcitrate dehydratase PrpD